MQTIRRHASPGLPQALVWKSPTLLAVGMLLSSISAFAAAPPAKQEIGNTASATFKDALGGSQTVTSNPVVTVVQQVGAFTVDGFATATATGAPQAGRAGTTVLTPHMVTNTGNGPDQFRISVLGDTGKFSKIEIFQDDGNGIPAGAALCTTNATVLTCDAPAVTVAGGNGNYKFLVAYTLPSSATSAVGTAWGSAKVTVTPATASLYATVPAIALTDTFSLATGAAFYMTKRIGLPDVGRPGGQHWPTANGSGKVSPATGCPTTWSANLTQDPRCVYTVYTLTFTNTGNVPGRFALSDTLPVGLTYVAGSALWSNDSSTPLTDGAQGDPRGIDYQFSGNKLTAVVESIQGSYSQTLSFVALVNSQALAGPGATANTAYYNPVPAASTTDSNSPGTLPTATTTVTYGVSGNYRVAVGSLGSTNLSAPDSTPGTPNASDDTTTVPSAVAGTRVLFQQRVFNLGDTEDIANLTMNPGTFPAGTSFLFYSADQNTPLWDTSGDQLIDTGPIPAGQSKVIVVGATLPSGTPAGNTKFTATLTVRSAKDSTKSDTTLDELLSVSTGLVDLTNTAGGNLTSGTTGNGDTGPGPSPEPTVTKTTTRGVPASFNLYIANNDSAAHVYELSYGGSENFMSSVPTGWTVTFASGADASCAAAGPMPTTPSIASHAFGTVTACVTPPNSQQPVANQKIYFRVKASLPTVDGIYGVDTITDAVTVALSAEQQFSASLIGDNRGQVASGGVVDYSHILTAVGAQACGAYSVEAKLPAEDITNGWSTQVYLDNDKSGGFSQGDEEWTAAATTSLAPGAANAKRFVVRVKAPQRVSPGHVAQAIVTATFAAGANSCGAPFVTDISTVNNGVVTVDKVQAIDHACAGATPPVLTKDQLPVKPGECIYYKVQASNTGLADLDDLTIHDVAPGFTILNGTGTCVGTGVVGVAALTAAQPQVTCGGKNKVSPNGSLTLEYRVKVQD